MENTQKLEFDEKVLYEKAFIRFLSVHIGKLADISFSEFGDVKEQWKDFRKGLKKIEKLHNERYQRCLENNKN